ncbi:MAG: carbohydrate-binding domain-containing protein, partial [Firmicutes bacterium]|nr:carbohydrate-binding domain-containing protein [Bacillota bacterium]
MKNHGKRMLSLLLCCVLLLWMLPAAVFAEGETSVDLFDALAALTDTTELPASFDYTLGSEPKYSVGSSSVYAKLLKVEITEADLGKALNISFIEKNEAFPGRITIFDDISGTAAPVAGGIFSMVYPLTSAGTYYIVLGAPEGCIGECHAELAVTEAPTDVFAGFEALTDSVELPASFDYTLGSEELYSQTNTAGTFAFYAKLLKIDVTEANSRLVASFNGKNEDLNVGFRIFYKEEGTFQQVGGGLHDTNTTLEKTGTYYIALSGYNSFVTGECHAELSLVPPPETVPMTDGLAAITDTTSLPVKFDYTLGSENKLYTQYYEEYDDTYNVFATMMKVELEESSVLSVRFAGADESVDTTLWLFGESGGAFTLIERSDSDRLNGNGESAQFILQDAGTYYIVFSSYDDDDCGPCHGEVSVVSFKNAYQGCLDFTQATLPVPGEGDKWSWDSETNTLTLEDGFAICCEEDYAINLPEDSTVVVNGEAAILAEDIGINAYNLNIKGGEGSRLSIFSEHTGIDSTDILIEDCELYIRSSEGYGVHAYGSITVRRSVLDIDSVYECLNCVDDDDIIIENSSLRLVSCYDGIETDNADVCITDSDVNIDTTYDGDGIYTGGSITVTGGRLVIAALEGALRGNTVTLSDVVFDLRNVYDYYNLLRITSTDGFSLPGTFRLYDARGNLLYEGEWKDELLKEGNLYVDNVKVVRAVSVHEHTWSEDWTYDDTHHWHECTEPYCVLTENADKDGYGEHEGELKNAKPATATENGYTGDTVCKVCGKLLAAGQVIPATGEQPTNPTNPSEPVDP